MIAKSIFKKSTALIALWIFLFSDVPFALRPQSARDRLPKPDAFASAESSPAAMLILFNLFGPLFEGSFGFTKRMYYDLN
jgi:hypothetical protein